MGQRDCFGAKTYFNISSFFSKVPHGITPHICPARIVLMTFICDVAPVREYLNAVIDEIGGQKDCPLITTIPISLILLPTIPIVCLHAQWVALFWMCCFTQSMRLICINCPYFAALDAVLYQGTN